MPEVIGKFFVVTSSMPPVVAHAAHLRHLSSTEAARRHLKDRFGLKGATLKEASAAVSAHIEQALNFHTESLSAPQRLKPVLQYYCYLNLAVAVVQAYRPKNFEQHRRHGVEDRSHALKALDLNSTVVKATSGAVPLFHSLISADVIYGRSFRVNELVGSVPLTTFEMEQLFETGCQHVSVEDDVRKNSDTDKTHSQVTFTCQSSQGQPIVLTQRRLERAMPDLASLYDLVEKTPNKLTYRSKSSWSTEGKARLRHRELCRKLINFGGQGVSAQTLGFGTHSQYRWHGIPRKPLLPTLTAGLLLSFGLASISRYRPTIAKQAEGSRLNVLVETFIGEIDSVMIPAMRNLLYREEMAVTHVEAI